MHNGILNISKSIENAIYSIGLIAKMEQKTAIGQKK